jgi:benzoate membrane transport protein
MDPRVKPGDDETSRHSRGFTKAGYFRIVVATSDTQAIRMNDHPATGTPDTGHLQAFSPQAFAAGLLAAFVGFASSFAVIIQGLTAVGASQAEAASGLMALSLSMGLCAIILSLRSRQPISIAWSTPGAALLAATAMPVGGFATAVGAFLVCGLLIVIAGLWKPLGRAVAAIPGPLANAMLAGVLLGLCLAPIKAVAQTETSVAGLVIIVTWAIVARVRRLYAVPAAVLVTVVIIAVTADVSQLQPDVLWPQPVLVMPHFSLAGLIGIALPLFIVTMASQNIPGIAVLNVNGYRPDPGPLFSVTGIFSLAAAPFGGHAVNLAAITAALCAGVDAHPDPARRYWAAATSGIFYILFGLGAGAATAFISAAPPILIQAVAGLALFGAFGSSLLGAVTDPQDREAAIITFVVTASGLSFFGISGAFWGLLAGGAVYALTHWRRRT